MRHLLAALILFAAGVVVGVRYIAPWLRWRFPRIATWLFGR